MMPLYLRTLISALVVGVLTAGNALQTVMQDGTAPTKWQVYSALLGGVIVAANDIKSRMTPTS